MEIREAKLEPDHLDVALSLNNLASLYNKQYRHNEAELLHKRSLEIRETKLGDHLDTAWSLSNLAECYDDQSRYSEAESCYQKALKIRETILGKDHLDVASLCYDLGLFYTKLNKYIEAESFLKRSLEIRSERLGEKDVKTAYSMTALGRLYNRLGNFDETEDLYKKSLVIMEEKLGKDHVDLGATLNNLAELYREQGRFSEAEPLYLWSLDVNEKNNGEGMPHVLCNLGLLRDNQGRFAEAEVLYRKSLLIREAMFDKDHPDIGHSLSNLAMLYHDQGRYAEAEKMNRRVLEITEKSFGEIHTLTAVALNNMALIMNNQGRDVEAEALYRRSLEIRKTILGDSHPMVANALSNLGMWYKSQGQDEKAESFLKQALEIRESKLDKDHPDTATSLNNLAFFYNDQGRHSEAEPLFDRAIAIFETKMMDADSGSLYYGNRAWLYHATERPDEAVSDLKLAMDLSLQVRKNVSGTDEERAKTFERYYHLFTRMVEWQYEFSQNGNENYNIDEAYEAMELSRGRGLQDLIDTQGIDLLKDVPPETAHKLRADEKQAQVDIKSFEKQLEVLVIRKDMDVTQKKAETEKLEALLMDARKRMVDAEAAIKNTSPFYREILGKDRKPVPFTEVEKQLEVDSCLALEYLIGEEKSYLLVYGFMQEPILFPLQIDKTQAALFGVEPGAISFKKLNAIFQNEKNEGILQLVVAPWNIKNDSKLDREAFNKLREKLTEEYTLKLHEKLAALWPTLLPDEKLRTKIIADQKSLNRLLILPDGPLAKFPFEMLVVNGNVGNPQYLLDKGPATLYAPSAGMYYNLAIRDESHAKSVLTVGDPIYEKTNMDSNELKDTTIRHRGELLSAKFGQLPRLRSTSAETQWIKDSCDDVQPKIPVLRLNRETSTEANVRENTIGRRIVHLACHGLADEEYGNMFGCLALTSGNQDNPTDDGFLELKEIFALDLKSCEITILSACDTNLGPNQQGEGTWSLSRGMLVAGSRRVVTTNWQVVDDASARLVSNFVKQLNTAKNFDYAAELRSAKIDLQKKRPHPYYWASFVLVGSR